MGARAAAVVAAVMLVAGCGAADAGQPPPAAAGGSSQGTPGPGDSSPQQGPQGAPVKVSGSGWAHVHALAYDGDALVVGTHEGLYRQEPGRGPELLSAPPFDVMGLAFDGDRWLASGHPGKGQDLPSDLGLRTSPDGREWTTVSLLGEVDFHRLTADGPTVVGVSAHDGALLRSSDGGATWGRADNPGAFDVALKPGEPLRMLATTGTGPVLTVDGGSTWRPLAGAPLIALVAWTPERAYGVAPDGSVHVSADDGATWERRGSAGGQPVAAAAAGDRVAVLVGDTVQESTDGGASFTPRLVGIGGH